MTARLLLPTQPITQKGDLPSRDLVEIIQRLVAVAGTGGGGGLADGAYGDVTVSGGGTVITINSGAVSVAEVSGLVAALAAKMDATTTLDAIPAPVASVDFAQEQALQFVIENRTSDPGAPVAGQIWLRQDL